MWIVETLQNTTMTMALLEKEIRLEKLVVTTFDSIGPAREGCPDTSVSKSSTGDYRGWGTDGSCVEDWPSDLSQVISTVTCVAV